MQTTDLGSNRLKLLAAQNENRIKRDMLNQAFGTIAAYDPSFEVAKYQGMMQSTASLPIPGIQPVQKPKPVMVFRETKPGRKFRA